MHSKIQINKKKIAELDPKFWDDAASNSVVRADDVESSLVEEDPELHSDMERPISDSVSSGKRKLSTNRII